LTDLLFRRYLVNRAAENDVSAIRELYDRFSREILSISYRITGNMSESEDILQESFLTSFDKLGKLEKAAAYPDWLKNV
jgi:RNA polymerase sigma-70 factor (ECF subfamily)